MTLASHVTRQRQWRNTKSQYRAGTHSQMWRVHNHGGAGARLGPLGEITPRLIVSIERGTSYRTFSRQYHQLANNLTMTPLLGRLFFNIRSFRDYVENFRQSILNEVERLKRKAYEYCCLTLSGDLSNNFVQDVPMSTI